MKTIYVAKCKKKVTADASDGVIDKPEGIYEDIVEVFSDSPEYAQEMVEEVQDEEFEKEVAQEAMQNRPEDMGLDLIQMEGTPDVDVNEVALADALSYGKDVEIGYFTYNTGAYIERTIRPEYVYYAKTTRNTVLVSWCYDWDDYRAFVIPNIVFVKEADQTAIEG